MDAKDRERIIAEGRRRILVRLEVFHFPPDAEIEEGPLGADVEEELVPKAEHYFVQAQWVHPKPDEISRTLQNQAAAMGISAAMSIKQNRTELDFRNLQKAGVYSRNPDGSRTVKAPDGVPL